jgi:hypothetical protein
MELYMLAGISKQAGAMRVADALQKLKAPLKGKWGAPAWKIVSEWRDSLSRMAKGSRRASDVLGASFFDMRRQSLRAKVCNGTLDPIAAAENQLKQIEGILRRSGK